MKKEFVPFVPAEAEGPKEGHVPSGIEGYHSGFEKFTGFMPDDAKRVEEIKRLREELLKSGAIPKEARDALSGLDVVQKAKEVMTAIEERGMERETIAVDEERKEVRIGLERTPIFEGAEKQLSWSLEAEQFREEGQTMAEVFFQRSDGVEIRPGGAAAGEKIRLEEKNRFLPLEDYKKLKKEYPAYAEAAKNLASSDPKVKAEAERHLGEFREKYPASEWAMRGLRHLNAMAVEQARDIVGSDPDYEETPYNVEMLEKFTKLVNRQLERKQGMVIIEGDAGTGKNKDVAHFAFLTRRPLFRFVCAPGKDEQDLKYFLEYDPKKGTYRIKSTVVEALETPGAILEFDEVNTLKPEVAKATLNPLLDEDRAIFLGEAKKKIKAADDVILVGLENPQHYMGVKPLAETIRSRARIMEKGYPPFEKAGEPGKFRSDEAMIIRHYIPELKGLSRKEFQILWDTEVNKKTDPRAADLLTAKREESVEDTKEIVEIANRIRQAYRAYHEGKSDDPIKFVFSLRESVECAYELGAAELTEADRQKGITRAKKAVSDVIIPKIPVGEERTYLAAVINEI